MIKKNAMLDHISSPFRDTAVIYHINYPFCSAYHVLAAMQWETKVRLSLPTSCF